MFNIKQCRSEGDEEFQKKTFTRQSFPSDLSQFVRNLPRLARAKKADRVRIQFAEKIMLAVTAVNDCRYCTRYHTNLAVDVGVDKETVEQILENDVDAAVTDEELPALLFAQRYAETNGNPGQEALTNLREIYGPEKADDVLAFVRAIYFGNLLGNSYDAIKFAFGCQVRRVNRSMQAATLATRRTVEQLREWCPG